MESLLELSFPQLTQQAIAAFPDTQRRQHATDTVAVTDIQLLPADGALIAKGTVRGSSGRPYQCVIELQGVQYNPDDQQNQVTFVSGEQEYKIVPINYQSTDCKVSCTCLDFRIRFAHYNDGAKALHGPKPDLYARVPGSNRPEANPKHSPGVCKHLMDFADSLQDSGLFG